MLRSPKLQKRASDSEGLKMGVLKIEPPNFFGFGVLAKRPKMGCAKSTPPCVPLWGQLPIVKASL